MTFLEEEEVFPTVEATATGAAVTVEVNDTSEVLGTNQNNKRKLPDKPVEKKVLFLCSFDLSLLLSIHNALAYVFSLVPLMIPNGITLIMEFGSTL